MNKAQIYLLVYLYICIIAHYWPLSAGRAQGHDQSGLSDSGPMRFHNPRRMSSLRASKPNSSGSIARPWRITRLRNISICSALLAVSRSNGICWASCSIACLLYHCSCVSDMCNRVDHSIPRDIRELHLITYGNMHTQSDSRFFLSTVQTRHLLTHV